MNVPRGMRTTIGATGAEGAAKIITGNTAVLQRIIQSTTTNVVTSVDKKERTIFGVQQKVGLGTIVPQKHILATP